MEAEKVALPKTGLTFGMGTLQTNSSSTSSAFPGFSFKPSTGIQAADFHICSTATFTSSQFF